MLPAYSPLCIRSKPMYRTVTVWPSNADSVLQDCFERTDWQVFRQAAAGEVDLEEYTSAVLSYISKCADDVTTT